MGRIARRNHTCSISRSRAAPGRQGRATRRSARGLRVAAAIARSASGDRRGARPSDRRRRRSGRRLGRQGVGLAGDRHRGQARGRRRAGADSRRMSLVFSMPQIRCVGPSGRRASVAAIASPAAGLCPPSSQSSAAPARLDQRPGRSRCIRAGQTARGHRRLAGGLVLRRGAAAPPAPRRHCGSGAGRAGSAAAGPEGRSRPERPAGRARSDVPVLALGQQRRAQRVRPRLDHLHRRVLLRADDAGHAALDDAGLFAGDLGQRLAKILLVVDRDRRDDRQPRPCRPRWSRPAARPGRPPAGCNPPASAQRRGTRRRS